MDHRIELSPATLHGVFSRDLTPVATVNSGDRVTLSTLDAWWGLENFRKPYGDRRVLEAPGRHQGHALTGPIAVRGLRAGEVLEIEFEAIVPGTGGFTECGGVAWPHYQKLACGEGGPKMLLWDLDRESGTARSMVGGKPIAVPVKPFLGVVGMPPAEPGVHSTTPPRVTGGNLDCNLLTTGTRLFLPVAVDGGLLSVGDGHAAQGDGEVSNNGIECGMDEVRLKLTRRADLRLLTPVIRTPDSWVTLGLAPSLDEAAYRATNAMLDLMTLELGCSRAEALGIASVAVDLRVTQIVNGVKGIHAVWKPG